MNFSIEDQIYSNMKFFYNNRNQTFKSIIGRIYKLLPIRFRYGKVYINMTNFLPRSQYWSKNQIEKYQWRKIKNLLQHSYENVPHYKKMFDERCIKLNDIQNFNDFKNIPLLKKSDIQKNIHSFLAKNIPKNKLITVTTGGSTGTPLKLYYEKGLSRPIELAFTRFGLKRIGYNHGDKIVVLRGEIVRKTNDKAPSYLDPIKNRLVLSSYHLIEENLSQYIQTIINFKPKFIIAYPSSLTILANYINKININDFNFIRGIITSSETLHEWQKNILSKAFNCNVYSWYGLNEFVALAGPCEYSSDFHFFPEYSYIEFLEVNDNSIKKEDENIREVVGTNLYNYAMPLIRYRTMDYVIPSEKSCKCGRNYPIASTIVGRKQEFFIDKTGSMIPFTGMNRPLRIVSDKINAFQYLQTIPGKVVLKIEKKIELEEKEIKRIKEIFKTIYSRFEIEIEFVDFIPRTKNGKFIYLDQKINT